MIYDAQARKDYKAQARADIRKKFWPTIGAVILASIPLALMSIIMGIGMQGFDTLGDASGLDTVLAVYGKFARYGLLYLVIYSLSDLRLPLAPSTTMSRGRAVRIRPSV